MNRFKVMATIFCVSIMALALSPMGKAQQRALGGNALNKKTVVNFSAPMEIPGVGAQVLPAGTYVIRLVDSNSNRDIVQILNEDESHVYATILAIPNYRLTPTDKTVMTFRERAAGQPVGLRAWFSPGQTFGEEFVYPKARAIELARITRQPVLEMPEERAQDIVAPIKPEEEPPVALREAPIKAVTPKGEEVEVAQVIPPKTEVAEARLPKTASSLPLLGLLGLLSLGSGFALLLVSKRVA
jgi:hypothetical protein